MHGRPKEEGDDGRFLRIGISNKNVSWANDSTAPPNL